MATELGKAYVQIMPSAKGISSGIKNVLGAEMGGSTGSALGAKLGKTMAIAAAGAVVAAGIGKIVASSIAEGAKLQQSKGGIQTLFKKDADLMQKYAERAFRTVGISANQYMEIVTSFSASLLQGLGGDTKKAAKIADMAMRDMGDNANKFGTDMQSIQNAYQGFARGQYMMLDNLKLGYGGTKEEMERLLKDAQKISGQKYDINNLSDVYTAIHVIQTKLGVTGTTAKEASSTFTGSFNSMRAAADNLLGALASGEGVDTALQNLASTVATFVGGNLLPMVGTILKSLALLIINNINKVPGMIDKLGNLILAKGPAMVTSGLLLITQLAVGIIKATPAILKALGTLILKAVAAILKGAIKFISIGGKFVSNLVSGFKARVNTFIDNCGGIAGKALRAIRNGLPGFKELGADIVRGMINGVKSLVGSFGQAIRDMVRSGLTAGKKESKTGSPSRLFRDELGKWIPLGAAEGVKKYTKSFDDAITDMIATSLPSAQAELGSVGFNQGVIPGIANSVVDGMSMIANGMNVSPQGTVEVKCFLYPNGPSAGKAVVNMNEVWGGRLNG